MDGDDDTPAGRDHADVPTDAAELRGRCRSARRDLDEPTRRAAQSALIEHLLALTELSRPGRVALYLATDGEVDLSEAAVELRRRGWHLFMPVVGPERSMSFARWTPGSPLVRNRHGVDEPAHDPADLVPAAALDATVVPCVAVDPMGHRVGFGAGYYDRALAGVTGTLRIGVAFEVQVVDRIRPESWDEPLDLVVTESWTIRTREPGAVATSDGTA